jgi:hypothetical protein
VTGEAKVTIDHFRMIDAPGNAVFPYFSANLGLDMGVRSLKLLNLTLRKLPGYSFEGSDTRFSVRTEVKKGLLQPGSTISSVPSELTLRSPGMRAKGFGSVKWEVNSESSSHLSANLRGVQLLQNSDARLAGNVDDIHLGIKLYGTELVDAFHGLWASLSLKKLSWNVQSTGHNPNLQYDGKIVGDGRLSGFSGEVPKSERKRNAGGTNLKLKIQKLDLKTSFMPKIQGSGDISVHAFPVDLSENSIHFPKLDAHLNLNVGKNGEVKTEAKFGHLEYRPYPSESWKGQLEWKMDRTDPFIQSLVQREKISSFLGDVAKVKNFVVKLDCEVGKDHTWLRFNEINSGLRNFDQ